MGRPAAAASTAKATKPAATKKASEASHPTYRDMIADAISTLKERNGSSRQAIKKYIQSNFKDLKNFDTQFNAALRRGVEKGDFVQPKGPSGTVKLNIHKKKEAAAKAKAAAAPKADAAEKPKKAAAAKKETAKKEAKPAKEKAAAKPKEKAEKANAAKKAAAVTDKPTVLTKTKSGRVSKGTAAAPKKTAAKKKAAVISKKAAAAAPATEA
ncbi:histone H1 [Peziza echinospora]|nr:histone H1 [Peziza echinospora]